MALVLYWYDCSSYIFSTRPHYNNTKVQVNAEQNHSNTQDNSNNSVTSLDCPPSGCTPSQSDTVTACAGISLPLLLRSAW